MNGGGLQLREEAEQLRNDPLVGVLLEVMTGVVELGHGRVGQRLAPLLKDRGVNAGSRIAHMIRAGLERNSCSIPRLSRARQPGDRSGVASGDLARKDKLAGPTGPRRVRR